MNLFRGVICVVLLCCSLFTIQAQTRDWDTYLLNQGLKEIAKEDPSIRIYLMYAHPDNFMGESVYAGLTKGWLRPEAMTMLLNAQRLLKKEYPGRSLIVYDAARPMSVQHKMWALVRGTDKTNYVANPANGGGLHNYGMAVDVSIVDETGTPLSMGTPVDYFGEEAHTTDEESLLETGKISKEAFQNRRYLRRIMREAGFRVIPYEWWHFNACSRAEARESYPVLQ